MASAFVVWERSSKSFIGGAQPIAFPQSADAQAQINKQLLREGRSSGTKAAKTYDIVTVTVA